MQSDMGEPTGGWDSVLTKDYLDAKVDAVQIEILDPRGWAELWCEPTPTDPPR